MVHCLHIWTGHFATLRKRQKQKQPKINYRAGPGRLSRTKVAGGPLVGLRFVPECESAGKEPPKRRGRCLGRAAWDGQRTQTGPEWALDVLRGLSGRPPNVLSFSSEAAMLLN